MSDNTITTVTVSGKLGLAKLFYDDSMYWHIVVMWNNNIETRYTGIKRQSAHVEKCELIKLMTLWVKVPYTVNSANAAYRVKNNV